MKIIIVSQTAWSNDNSFGSSFSNIFGDIDEVEIANVYCNYGNPKNNMANKYFQITEKSLLKNLRDKKNPIGQEILKNDISESLNDSENEIFNHARKRRLQIYFWIRDLIWVIGRWNSTELKNFIIDFEPDMLFQPLYYSNYMNDIILFVKQFTNAPMVCYVSDDVYTMRQFSLSPLFWIDRFIKRKKIKKVVEQCEYLYVISDIQKKDYEKCFKKVCKILTKGASFSDPILRHSVNLPLKLVYTGNIGAGRWKSLVAIGEQLKKINHDKIRAQLFVYTMTPMTKRMSRELDIEGSVFLMGGVPAERIPDIQADADILVHVESFDLKERLKVHHSLSTKIIDYLAAGRCIFAVGTMDMASINYLAQNDAAIIATSKEDINEKLNILINNYCLMQEYGEKAWNCGRKNHQIDVIQRELLSDLSNIIKDRQNECITN